jgi:hypothetical protein
VILPWLPGAHCQSTPCGWTFLNVVVRVNAQQTNGHEPPGQEQRGNAAARAPIGFLGSSVGEMVEGVRALPYGRPSDGTVDGMLRERRGTCSTKHLFLAQILAALAPETMPLIVHRVYRMDRARARELFGAEVAETIPEGGLVDVHRYLTIIVGGRRIAIDATFPGEPWNGRDSMPLACGPGDDHPAGQHPDAEKRALEEQHCEAERRERFIAALTRRFAAGGA